MNHRIAEIVPENKQSALEKYNEIVSDNLENGKGIDPDKFSYYECRIDGLSIKLAQDGLCGLKEIKRYSKNIEFDYKLIREGMFDCLVWPAYAISINQMKYSKYKDRLDLTLIDIQKFYGFVKADTDLTPEIVAIIFEKCELGRAYIFPHTFYWLRSYENYNCFIRERNLGAFVNKDKNDQFVATKWTNTDNFDLEYFTELLIRVNKYKKL